MLNLSVTSPSTIGQLIDLSLFANEARKASQDASKALDNATRGAIHYAAEAINGLLISGASLHDAYGIVRGRLDAEGYDAVMSHATGFDDLSKVVRQAQKIMSRVSSCAYAVVSGAPADIRINRLEGIAGHVRKGFPLSLVPLKYQDKGAVGRLHDVAGAVEESPEDVLRRQIAEQAEIIAAYKASLDSIMHGNSSVVRGSTSRKTGKQSSKLVAA